MKLRIRLLLGVGGSVVLGTAAHAATQPAPSPASQAIQQPAAATPEPDGPRIQDIVVTARRRAESLQNVPETVQAIGGAKLDKGGVRALGQLTQEVPGLVINQAGGAQPTISMRGDFSRVGSIDPGVGVFIDGIYQNRYTTLGHGPVDAARVEVAKGPQSTLYGKNTIGGAIGIITNDPTTTLMGSAEAGIGGSSVHSELLWHAQAILSGPITSDGNLLARIVVQHQSRDGYLYDPRTNIRGLGYDSTTLRGKLLWHATPDLNVKLTVNHFHDNAPRGDVLVQDSPAVIIPGINPALHLPQQPQANVWDYHANTKPYTYITASSVILNVDWQTAIGSIQSSTSYQYSTVNQLADSDDTEYPVVNQGLIDNDKAFQQDLRLVGHKGGWNYIAGLYYIHDQNGPFALVTTFLQDSTAYAAGLSQQYNSLVSGGNTYAAYSQVGYDITSALNMTGGLRFARDEKDAPLTLYNVLRSGALAPGALVNIPRRADFNSLTGDFTLSYKFNPSVMTYARFARGDKAGGFNTVASLAVADIPYRPEKLNAYEIGIKSEWFDHRVRLNASAYYNVFTDQQIQSTAVNPLSPTAILVVTSNAASSQIPGAELDLTVLATKSLQLNATYAYSDAKIGRYEIGPGQGINQDITGFPIPRTPNDVFNLTATYSHDVGPGRLVMTANYYHTSSYTNEFAFDLSGNPREARVPGYGLANFTVSYAVGSWDLRAFVRNAFNKGYFTGLNVAQAAYDEVAVPGEPRTYEFTIARSF